jgi:hypothetical protein
MSAAMTTPESTSVLDHARAAAARGWRPFPCKYNDKSPTAGIKWGTATAAVPTEKTLEWWFGRSPVNIGIPAKGSGLTFLDDDSGTADAMERLCEAYGREVPKTYRVRTAKGWHWYFGTPPGVEIANAGKGSYLKDEFGFDVRGNRGGQEDAGGYVIGAGSVHESGIIYTAEDPDAEVAPLPDWLLELLLANSANSRETGTAAPVDPDRERPYTMDRATDWILRYGINPLKTATEGGRNNALNTAAVVVGHFVPTFFSEEYAWDRLTELAEEVGLNPQEIGPTIRSGLRKGMNEPYDLVEADPFSSASGSAANEPDAFEVALQRERIRRQVKSMLDAEDREPLRVLSAAEFLDSPAPDYLVPAMLYRDGLAVMFGPPGAAKSFLALDIALSLATGTPWRGTSIGRGKVHYVMAEGQATNTLRARAWLTHHGVSPAELDGYWSAIPTAVMLTEAGIVDYLPLVEKDQPDLIILDTKNLMFAGKESQGDDYGLMLRVLHKLRTAAGGCSVVLIDHAGLSDDSRTRGSNAQKGGVETEIRVTDEGGVRKAEITRDKSGEIGTQWHYRLVQVPQVVRPAGVTAPAVCEALDASDVVASPFSSRFENWNDLTQPALPADIVTYDGPGKTAINALARFMRYSATGEVGHSMAQARTAVNEVYLDERGKSLYSRNTLDRAWDALVGLGRLTVSGTGGLTSASLWETKPGDPS